MFAHVHATGAGYFAHSGSWTKLANNATTLAGYGITDAQATLVSATNIKTINGTSLLGSGDLTVSGGSGADLYAVETTGSTDPTATGTLSLAIGSGADASGTRTISLGRATTASGENSIAIGNGATATRISSVAINGDVTGSASSGYSLAIFGQTTAQNAIQIGRYGYVQGDYGTAVGYEADITSSGANGTALGYNAKVSASGATAITNSYASGTNSFSAAITNNTSSYGATGANSIAIGYQSKATASGAVAIGDRNTASGEDAVVFGESNTGSGPFSFTAGKGNVNTGSRGIALGNANTVSDFYTFASGSQNTASQDYATAIGSKALANRQGKFAHGSSGFGTVGDSQYGRMILSKATTNATPTVLSALQGNTSSTDNMPVIPLGGAQAFSGLLVAKQTSSANVAAWEIKGLIVNHLGTTTLVNSTITVINNTPSWSGPALSADNTNSWLAITCTGAVATSIRWSCTLNTSELIYA